VVWSDVAYELAVSNTALPKALEYAQHAVEQQESESRGVNLSKLTPDDLARTRRIGSFWDTLGWVHFRLGHLDEAETYLYAAWLLSQSPTVGDHLGQVYEQQNKTAKAIHMYRLALATPEGNVPRRSMGRDAPPAGKVKRHKGAHFTGTAARRSQWK
jgi:tetratricopeptide (TPR) repeat protein